MKIESSEELPYAVFGDSDTTQIGEWVLAVGNPFNLTSTVTAGIISAKSRSLDPTGRTTQSYIQTDAAVNPGNSGGALINNKGELIGINTAIQTQTGSYVGYSFAVPSNIAKKVIEDILEYGNVQYGFLGVTGTSLNSFRAKELNVEDTEGFFINGIDKESGANSAGIRIGDIIKNIDGIKISKFSDLLKTLNFSIKFPEHSCQYMYFSLRLFIKNEEAFFSFFVSSLKKSILVLIQLGKVS